MISRLAHFTGSALLCAAWVLCAAPVFGAESGGGSAEGEWRVNRTRRLESKWREMRDAARSGDLDRASEAAGELDALRVEAGYSRLDRYALELAGLGRREFLAGRTAEARRIFDLARELSAGSLDFAIQARQIADLIYGVKAGRDLVAAGLGQFFSRPSLWLPALRSSLYPLLWALTLALYIAAAGYIAWNAPALTARIAAGLPAGVRGIGAPPAAVLLFCAPCWFGPVWSLIAWSCALLILAPRETWIPFCCGAVMALWGAVVPMRENLNEWLSNPSSAALLRVREGVYDPGDKGRITRLLKRQPENGVGWFVYGQLLRRQGAYPEASRAFERSESLLGGQTWVGLQRGLLDYLEGRYEEADRAYGALLPGGGDAAYWLNYSKIKFQLRDQEASSEYARRGERISPQLAEINREREERFGIRSSAAAVEIDLPVWAVVRRALAGGEDMQAVYRATAGSLVNGFDPRGLLILGGILAAAAAIAPRRRRSAAERSFYPGASRNGAVFCLLHLFPGLGWAAADRAGRSFLALSAVLALTLPVVQWPAESRYLLDALGRFYTAYLGALGVVVLGFYFLASQDLEEE